MNYGLYLSASGVMASSFRQDAIANNLANSETVGFKRDLALFQQRLTASQEQRQKATWSNSDLDMIGGGLLASPMSVDTTQGDFEPTGNSLDVAINGSGFFAIEDKGVTQLTRDGRFTVDRTGQLILANGIGQRVLDDQKRPIKFESGTNLAIGTDGALTENGKAVARLGLFDVPDPSKLTKQGGAVLSYSDPKAIHKNTTSSLRSGFIERANVDPTTELTSLMDAQRQLEANANMIRYQDQMLGKLVNEVGKIG